MMIGVPLFSEGAMSKVSLEDVLADVLLDGGEDVARLAAVLGPGSLTAGCALSIIIVFPTRSHAASNQTRGL